MLESGLIHTEIQRKWLTKLQSVKDEFQAHAAYNDAHSRFPHENIDWLVKEGYTLLTLPKAYGGEGATIEDMVIIQSYLGSIDGATALSIGWHLSTAGQIFEEQKWEPHLLDQLAQAAADYAKDFAKTHQPNSIDYPIGHLPTVQQSIGKMESLLLSARAFLWSTARTYHEAPDAPVWNETSASKILVMNQGLKVIDLAMRIVGAKSLEMDRPLQRYYRDMRAGLHNPPMEDAAYTNIAKSELNLF